MRALLLLLPGLLLTACGRTPETAAPPPPLVRMAAVVPAGGVERQFSGVIHARHEIPLAFQVGGRILRQHVQAGQTVRRGGVIFELDARDLAEALRGAEAEAVAARAAAGLADAELGRTEALNRRGFVSAAALDRARLAAAETRARFEAATARLATARNALGYARLVAPADGIVVELMASPGQFVPAGQPVARLALEGEREVEVTLPAQPGPPLEGRLVAPAARLVLREAAGALDPESRTWRARYRIVGDAASPPLGSVVRVAFAGEAGGNAWRVPLGALDERGDGPRLWRVVNGRAQPVPVRLLRLETDSALVAGEFTAGEQVVALGTHLLTPGLAVRTERR